MRGAQARAMLTLVGLFAVAACGKASSTSSATPSAAPTATPHGTSGAVSAVASSGSTCTQFGSGTLAALSQIKYTNGGGKVAHVTPATFDYWVKVVPTGAPPTTLTVTETTHGGGPAISATGGDVYSSAAGGTCTPLSNSVSYAAGTTKVSFTGAKGTTYFTQIHYTAAALVGQTLTPGSAGLTISTAEVTGSSNNLSLTAG